MKKNFFLLPLALIFLAGCSSYNDKKTTPSIIGNIHDNQEWYEKEPKNIMEASVRIPIPNDFTCKPWNLPDADPRPCTFDDVYHDTNPYDDYEPKLHVVFSSQEYSTTHTNASMKIKGKSTREAKQKSFRIKLDKDEPLYNDERTFQFNKHPYDQSRMRNRLFFSLFEKIPNFPSLRTRFVHLVMDQEGNETVDKGLFTHVESCDSLYLINHGFGEDDNLYKAQEFTFQIVPGMEVDEKGKPLNKKAFDDIIEMKNGKERTKLLEMIQAINDAESNEEFMRVFRRYFNEENYLTWMAVNIVSGNKDTVTQNFYLLNPKYSDTFYFLPWDYDGAAYTYSGDVKWSFGFGKWWAVPLHRKFLSIPSNIEKVDAKVQEIRELYMNDAEIHAKVDSYITIIEPFVTRPPDSNHLSEYRWRADVAYLRNEAIAENLRLYNEEKGNPMPFWQNVSYKSPTLLLMWDESVDLEGNIIDYNISVARDTNMTDIIFSDSGVSKENPHVTYESWGLFTYKVEPIFLEPGTYYYKVVAYERDNPAHYQIAFDKGLVHQFNNSQYAGILEFSIGK